MTVPEIVVCMKVVPRPEEVRIDPATLTLDRTNVRSMINPADMHALEMALALKDRYGGRVRLLSMGPPFFADYLRVALATGADEAYLLSDRAFGGADTLATSYTLAAGVRKLGTFDLVICGEESSDGATAQVPAGIAEWLGVAQVTGATDAALVESRSHVWARRALGGGHETLGTALPAVISVQAHAMQPRFMAMDRRGWAAEAPITIWDATDLGTDPEWIGAAGSPTIVAGTHEAVGRHRRRERLTGSAEAQARALLKRLRPQLDLLATRPQRSKRVEGDGRASEPRFASHTVPPPFAASRRLRRREATAPPPSSDDGWSGRAMLVDEGTQTVVAHLLADLWKGPAMVGVTHWGGVIRTECGGGHLPQTGEYLLRFEDRREARLSEHGPVKAYAERGLNGEQVEVKGIGAPPF
jgi:electron transfer flavoprotein beta subunit